MARTTAPEGLGFTGDVCRSGAPVTTPRLISFLAALGLTVAGLVVPAASAGAVDRDQIDLRHMTVAPASAGAVLHAGDSPDNYLPLDLLGLWRNGVATAEVDLSSTAAALHVAARADLCEGAPVLEVFVDGVRRLSTSVTTRSTGTYAVRGPFSAGRHTVALRYANDHSTATCDRNLKVLHVAFDWEAAVASYTLRGHDLALTSPSAGGAIRWGPAGLTGTMLWARGSAYAHADLQGATHMVVTAASKPCEGHARIEVWADGARLWAQTLQADDGMWYEPRYSVPLDRPLRAGMHSLEIVFANPHHTATCDRAVKIKGLQLSARL
jgi:hypothetical protein